MAQALKCRPSSLYGLEEDSFEAYALDSAVVRWGSAFSAALSDAVQDAKKPEDAARAQQRILRRWLPSERRYADPRQAR